MDLKSLLSVKIPTFHGNVMKWSEFWELFAITVHDNPGVADVKKIVILKSHLAGVALRAIQGIPVSGEGYIEAVTLLKERFELKDVCREKLMKDMLNMPSVRVNDLNSIRSLIDHIMAHTRALKSLEVTAEGFSSLLLPIVKEKLPENWRLEWARRNSSNFTEFLSFLQQEIRVREMARGVTDSPQPSIAIRLSARRVIHAGSPEPPREPGALTFDVFGRGLGQTEGPPCMEQPARWGAATCPVQAPRAFMLGMEVTQGVDPWSPTRIQERSRVAVVKPQPKLDGGLTASTGAGQRQTA